MHASPTKKCRLTKPETRSDNETMATPIVVGSRCFVGGDAGYLATVIEVHEETSSAYLTYEGYPAKYNEWLSFNRLISMPTDKQDRKARSNVGNKDDLKPKSQDPPGSASPRSIPGPTDVVEVFNKCTGWRSGMIEARDESFHLGSIVRFNDGVSPSAAVIHLPQDFVDGDVRWPRKQGVGDLEGRRVMVPSKVFGQTDRDGHGGYAGTVKRDTGWRATIHFFIDGKEITFACEKARDWLLDDRDKAANAAWEEQAPSTMPARWPCDVIFCSFPLQQGIHPGLLKRFCALSELMAGVDIRTVDAGHPLAGTRYSLGLFATRDFRRGVTIGQYSGMLEPSGRCRRWSQTSEGRFDIALDTAEALSSAQGLTLDAKFVGNEGRIINDFRGIAEENNVRFRTSSHPTKSVWVDIVATRAIAHGEEILADYDYGMRREDDQPSTTRQIGHRRAQPPDAPAERFELDSVRSGADGGSRWRVAGSYEGFKEAGNSKKRKQGSFRQRWVLVPEESQV